MITFDLNQIPFSIYGSYLAISRMTEYFEGLYIRTVRGKECLTPVLKIDMIEGSGCCEFEECASPGGITLTNKGRKLEFTFQDKDTIRCRGNTAIQLTRYNDRIYSYANYYDNNHTVEITYGNNYKLMLVVDKGVLEFEECFDRVTSKEIRLIIRPDEGGALDFSIDEFTTAYIAKEHLNFDVCRRGLEADFAAFLDKIPPVGEEYAYARETCAYVDYVSVVAPCGHHKRDTMYMSKNVMTNVWCWDRCFNVLALTKKFPQLAFEQIKTIFDHQNEFGCLPDCVNDRLIIWDYVKTPLDGWALLYMMDHSDYLTQERLLEIYEPLKKWTQWWFNYRDYDHDGLPQYNSGLDSGWDNNSIFAGGNLVEAPDLIAFLILQYDALAEIAKRLCRYHEQRHWEERSKELLDLFLKHSYNGERFLALRSSTHTYNEDSQSLMNFVPLILGDRLPEEIRTKMIEELSIEGRFLSKFGVVTEAYGSVYHDPCGYWSGPVWGPATTIIVDGLIRSGADDLAREIARRYCNLVRDHGTAENFNSETGNPQNDRAYTWSTSAFLILASYLESGVF